MSLLSRSVAAARRVDGTTFSMGPRVSLTGCIAEMLTKSPLIVADVGAAGGVDPRWQSLRGLVRFLAFEPRSDEVFVDPTIKRFSTALGDRKGSRALHVTRYSQSSSLYPLNYDLLNDFMVRAHFELLRVESVEVNTLDNCLATAPGDWPDFLKVDVEGAELEVLRGSEAILKKTALGIRTEVSFAPRHVGAALFGDVDSFLRQRGYTLFVLNRELMIRDQRFHTPISQPQCVWGDALYFLTRRAFFERLQSTPPDQRAILTVKFVTMLCAHGAYDYAAEVVAASRDSGIIEPLIGNELTQAIRLSVKGARPYFCKGVFGLLFSLIVWLISLPSAKSRSLARAYVRRRAGYVFHYFWRITARGGECDGSVSDLQI
jgi:FkbM family methyltransferase